VSKGAKNPYHGRGKYDSGKLGTGKAIMKDFNSISVPGNKSLRYHHRVCPSSCGTKRHGKTASGKGGASKVRPTGKEKTLRLGPYRGPLERWKKKKG